MSEIFQRFFDLFPPQAALRQQVMKAGQGVHVHEQLICVLVEQRQKAVFHRALRRGDGGHRFPFRRAGAKVFQPRAVPGVAFDQKAEGRVSRGLTEQRHVFVFLIQGAQGLAVHIH